MNKAANIIANSIIGEDFKVIILGGEAYTVKAPTIGTICRAIKYLSLVDKKESLPSDFTEIKSDLENILKGLAVFIFQDEELYVRIENSTLGEIKEAFETIIKLISAEDFFVCAALAESVARMAAKQE